MEKIISPVYKTRANWQINPQKSKIRFSISQLLGELIGEFSIISGFFKTTLPDFSGTKIHFLADVGSLRTGNSKRDRYFQSKAFLDSYHWPHLIFESKIIKKTGIDEYGIEGLLTLKNITRRIDFVVEYKRTESLGPGKMKASFRAVGKIKRKDFGIDLNPWIDTGNIMIDEWLTVIIELEGSSGQMIFEAF